MKNTSTFYNRTIFNFRGFLYIVWSCVLSIYQNTQDKNTQDKNTQDKSSENICVREKIIHWLTFKPWLALALFTNS